MQNFSSFSQVVFQLWFKNYNLRKMWKPNLTLESRKFRCLCILNLLANWLQILYITVKCPLELIYKVKLGISIEIFKVHTFFNMSPTPQAFFFYITLKRTCCYEKWYQFLPVSFLYDDMCRNNNEWYVFFLSTTVHSLFLQKFRISSFHLSWNKGFMRGKID